MDKILAHAFEGGPGDGHAEDRAREFLHMASGDKEEAISLAIHSFAWTGTLTGFISGVGGLMYSAIAMPTDILYQIYLGVRLSLVIASIYGLPLKSVLVTSMAQACALGSEAAAQVSKCIAEAVVKGGKNRLLKAKLGPLVFKINQLIGYRFVTIAGKTGTVNLVQLIPFLGGVVAGGFNRMAVQAVGNLARQHFKHFNPEEDD